MWLTKPFNEQITFKRLFGYWLIFLISGIALKELLTPLYPIFIETENEIIVNFCQPITILETIIAPVGETLVFMILPYWWKQEGGLIVGLFIWAILHLISKDIPIFIYICIISVFYFKSVSAKKYREVILFHSIINYLGLLTCL